MSDTQQNDDGRETDTGGGEGAWSAMGFANRDGVVAQAWCCPLPAGFADRVVNDPDGLEQEVTEQAAAVGGRVMECGQITVDGRPAFYRIVQLPAGDYPRATYVAGLIVPIKNA
jgi:hypothetical protein